MFSRIVGDRPVAEIEAPELVSVFRRIEARGVRETVHRAKQDGAYLVTGVNASNGDLFEGSGTVELLIEADVSA
jgi:hypothetical protein